jgi:hypothetical protein
LYQVSYDCNVSNSTCFGNRSQAGQSWINRFCYLFFLCQNQNQVLHSLKDMLLVFSKYCSYTTDPLLGSSMMSNILVLQVLGGSIVKSRITSLLVSSSIHRLPCILVVFYSLFHMFVFSINSNLLTDSIAPILGLPPRICL